MPYHRESTWNSSEGRRLAVWRNPCRIADWTQMDIAIIGAGMAGLVCGQRLSANGHRVQLFDKGRRPWRTHVCPPRGS